MSESHAITISAAESRDILMALANWAGTQHKAGADESMIDATTIALYNRLATQMRGPGYTLRPYAARPRRAA